MSEEIKSTDGRRWAIFKRFDIPDAADTRRIYLTRWRFVMTPWFGIYLHRINTPDSDRYLHDHPWEFVSVILWGGYIEQVRLESGLTKRFHWRRGTAHLMRTTMFHAIQTLDRVPTWSLVLTGPRKRVWGFLTDQGWKPFNEVLGE